jgi:hypothetical protein
MGDLEKKEGEGQEKEVVKLEDFNALKTQLETIAAENKALKEDLHKTKVDLLDPRYLAALEKAEKGEATKKDVGAISKMLELSEDEIAAMPEKKRMAFVVQEATKAAAEAVKSQYGEEVKGLRETIDMLQGQLELKTAKAEHPDFDEYKDDMLKLMKTNPSANLEQLYTLAKAEKTVKKSDEEKAKEAKLSGEKPIRIVSSSLGTKQSFKSAEEAASAAWDEVVGKAQSI